MGCASPFCDFLPIVTSMKAIEVAAIIVHQGRILCVQRGPGRKPSSVSYKYEFPGGKLEPGEAAHTALMRELAEELDIHTTIRAEDYVMTVDHTYPECHIVMHAYRCEVDTPSFTLTEHIDYRWLPPDELGTLDWAPADIPIAEYLTAQPDRCWNSFSNIL